MPGHQEVGPSRTAYGFRPSATGKECPAPLARSYYPLGCREGPAQRARLSACVRARLRKEDGAGSGPRSASRVQPRDG